MELYTTRHALRKSIKRTNKISVDVYGVLIDICEKYYKNLTHLLLNSVIILHNRSILNFTGVSLKRE